MDLSNSPRNEPLLLQLRVFKGINQSKRALSVAKDQISNELCEIVSWVDLGHAPELFTSIGPLCIHSLTIT